MRPGVVVLAALCAAGAWGQPKPQPGVPQAVPAEQQAQPADADWLQANPRDPRWPEAFRAFVRQTPRLDRVRAVLEGLTEPPQHLPPDLALEIGGLLEVAGSFEAAISYYGHAAQTATDAAARTTALLSAASVAWDLGAGDQAVALVDRALAAAADAALRAQLTVTRALLRHDLAPTQATLNDLRAATAAAPAASRARLWGLLALADDARLAGRTADYSAALDQLKAEYPQSPETVLLAGTAPVTRALSPRRLLRAAAAAETLRPPTPPAPPPPASQAAPQGPETASVRIQAGSFTVAENAAFMARDLNAAGFQTAIEKVELAGKVYHRVLLANRFSPEDARTTLIRLKEAGFEGVILP